MSLYEHLKRETPNFESSFEKAYYEAVQKLPYHVFKDAVLSNMKQFDQVLDKAA